MGFMIWAILPGELLHKQTELMLPGHAAGFSDTTTGDIHAFLYASGTMQDLGTLGGSFPSMFEDKFQGGRHQNSEFHAFLLTPINQ